MPHQIDYDEHLCRVLNVEDIGRTKELEGDNRDYCIVNRSCIQLVVGIPVEQLVALNMLCNHILDKQDENGTNPKDKVDLVEVQKQEDDCLEYHIVEDRKLGRNSNSLPKSLLFD